MKFSDTAIDAMLKAMGDILVIDDGSIDGQTIYCNFLAPRQIVEQFDVPLAMTAPTAKVRTTAVTDYLKRGLRVKINSTYYTIADYDHRPSGFTVLILEDV